MEKKLTGTLVKNLKSKDRRYFVNDSDVKGFCVRVEESGRKIFYARCRVNGRQCTFKIGDAAVMEPAKARDDARDAINKAVHGTDPMTARRIERTGTLEALIDGDYYEKKLKLERSGEATKKRLKTCFKDFMARKLSDPTLGNAIKNWQVQRIRDDKRLPATVNRDIGALKAVFAWALDRDYIKVHPLAKVKPLKHDQGPKVRFLDTEEEDRLLAALDAREEEIRAARDSHNTWLQERHLEEMPSLRAVSFADYLKPMVLLSLNTGMRRGEVFNLEWTDIDFDNARLTVRGQSAKSGKTRHIPLNQRALAVLKAWREQTDIHGLVFKADNGGRFDNVSSSWENLLERATVESFRWHDMRHHFASKLVMAGVNLNVVRELLGHADIKMTLRYAHLAPHVTAAAVEKVVIGQDNIVAFPAKSETA